MSLYQLDDSARNLLKLENFRGEDFSAKDFIETLSSGLSSEGPEAIDPKPYIRTFEAALGHLHEIQESTKRYEEQASMDVKGVEAVYSDSAVALGPTSDALMAKFADLDSAFTELSRSTSGLTERLDRLSGQRERTVMAQFLIRCYFALSQKESLSELTKLWNGGGAGDRKKCARYVSKMQNLIRRMGTEVPRNLRCQELIDEFAEKIETDLLQEFDTAYKAFDLHVMRECADILTNFNGGGSVIQVYVNQIDIFIAEDKIKKDSAAISDEDFWRELSSSDENNDTRLVEVVSSLVDEITRVLDEETTMLKKVFRHPINVLKVVIERIFAQRIQQQLEEYLAVAESQPTTIAYVRILYQFCMRIGSLVKNLKEKFQSEIDSDGELALLLDQLFADMFVPYIEGGRYMEAETKSLLEIFASITARFSEAHSHRRIERSLPANASSTDLHAAIDRSGSSAGNEKGRIGQFMRAVRLERNNSMEKKAAASLPTTGPEIEFTEDDYRVDYQAAQKTITAFSHSINRIVEIYRPSDLPKNASIMLELLIETLGSSYTGLAISDALLLSGDSTRGDLSLDYMQVISQASGIIQLMSVFCKVVLFPMASESETTMHAMIDVLNDYAAKNEENINKILHNSVDLILNRLNLILGRQKKKDYAGREDDSKVNETGTGADVVEFMSGVHSVAEKSLNGVSLQQFLIEIGIGFRDILLSHIKKFSVSSSGAMYLSRDLQAYQGEIDKWGINELSEAFSIFPVIGNLYTAEPQVLPSMLREGSTSRLKPFMIREYLSRRADYYPKNLNRLVPGNSIAISSYIPRYPAMF